MAGPNTTVHHEEGESNGVGLQALALRLQREFGEGGEPEVSVPLDPRHDSIANLLTTLDGYGIVRGLKPLASKPIPFRYSHPTNPNMWFPVMAINALTPPLRPAAICIKAVTGEVPSVSIVVSHIQRHEPQSLLYFSQTVTLQEPSKGSFELWLASVCTHITTTEEEALSRVVYDTNKQRISSGGAIIFCSTVTNSLPYLL